MAVLTVAGYRIETQSQLSRVVVPAFESAGVFHGFGLRGGLRPENWPVAAGAPTARLVTTTQIHSDRILLVSDGAPTTPADGLITDRSHHMIGVFTADCLPVLLAEPTRGVVAAVHAGWRGLAQRIVQKTVSMMTARWSVPARGVTAALGPCIGACCFEVGEQVLQPIKQQLTDEEEGIVLPHPDGRAGGKALVDLQAWATRQLGHAGVPVEQIFTVPLCTRCHPALFASYRRDGRQKQEMFSGILRL
ncbi:MAG TPA: peptidoglycan editing factor PgeF [Nitrospiria bacterium]|nr:peptidoglycan editing factor PgeF [Nitrospiria bacterium]